MDMGNFDSPHGNEGMFGNTNTKTQPSGGSGVADDIVSPIENVVHGGVGSTQPSGNRPPSGDVLDSPCNY